MYTITLADGTKIENLTLNGNNWVSQTQIDEAIFTDDALKTVTITDGETTEAHENMFLNQLIEFNGEYWFILLEKDHTTLLRETLEQELTGVQTALAEVYETVLGGGGN